MELVDGKPLGLRESRDRCRRSSPCSLRRKIAGATAKAHKMDITHRDLKPPNIMVTKAEAKLMDCGLAKEFGHAPLADTASEMTTAQPKLTVERTIVGAFQHMAPKQLEGKEADAPATTNFCARRVFL